MGRWFRYYEDALNDPKVQRLPGDLFKAWVNLLCLASSSEGQIKSATQAAFALRLKEDKARLVVAELASHGLLDVVPGGYFEPHNWSSRQFKSDVSNERVKRYRKRECNVTSTVTVTPPDTEQITEPEKERKKDAADAAPQRADDHEAQLFRRGKEVLGENAGGLIKNLLKAKGRIELARAAIEMAATKGDPREYVGAIIRGENRLDNDPERPKYDKNGTTIRW